MVYIGSSCSLLVIDRGNQAIREIQLHFDDCAYQYGSGFPFGKQTFVSESKIVLFPQYDKFIGNLFIVPGLAVLIVAGFLGYMLALLQRRVGTIVSSKNVSVTCQSFSVYFLTNFIPSDNYQGRIYILILHSFV